MRPTRNSRGSNSRPADTPLVLHEDQRCVSGAGVVAPRIARWPHARSEEHTSELQSRLQLVCRLLLEKKRNKYEGTTARKHGKPGRKIRPQSTTIDIHSHVAVPQASAFLKPHLDMTKIPLAHFAYAYT